eukprot:scaffold40607_cov38-Cyclotella_meneghiniana.AAC.4
MRAKRSENSFYLNQAMSWKRLLIEANPDNFKKLVSNRRNELVPPIHAAVCDVKKMCIGSRKDLLGNC